MHRSEQKYTVQLGFCNVHINRVNEYTSAVVAGVKAVFAAQNASKIQRKMCQQAFVLAAGVRLTLRCARVNDESCGIMWL